MTLLERAEPGRVVRPVAQQPRALAQRLVIGRDPRRHGPGRAPSTSRSRNRRRPPGPSRNRRSICGVSQSTPSCSASAAWPRAGSPSMRTTRRSPAVPSRPVPMRDGAAARRDRRRHRPTASRPRRLGRAAGGRSRRAGRRAGRGPAPERRRPRADWSCRRRSGRSAPPARAEVEPSLAIVAEIGQHQPRHADASCRGTGIAAGSLCLGKHRLYMGTRGAFSQLSRPLPRR